MTDGAQAPSETATATPEADLHLFLIADIRGYTAFTEQHGDEAAARLASHFADVVEITVSGRDGSVLELRGDEALAVFSSARQAFRAAVDLQSRLASESRATGLPLLTGIGIDAGEAVPVRGGYRGGALNLAARLASIAGPGDIFVSETAAGLARRVEGLEYVDRGRVELKGLKAPVRVLQIVREGEPVDDLPSLLQTLITHPTNLPDEATPFIGRAADLEAVRRLVQDSTGRLVTLIGPGGTGKTRLALQVGAALLYNVRDGVFFVSMAAVTDPDLVISAIAQVFDLKEESERPLLETVRDFLHTKQLLLVVDNLEHLLAGARVLSSLLDECPELRVLVTSRTVLRLAREHVFEVEPLAVPDPKEVTDAADLMRFDAVALFVGRAEAATGGFVITDENRAAVAEICYRLDGLPLAIELAAARVRIFPPAALLGRLSSRLKLLTGGARDLPERQQTLRGTIDWSYSLLAPEAQRIFDRLAVFARGWTLEAAEIVCNRDEDLEIELIDGITLLVEQSLVQRAEDSSQGVEDEPRFTILETIREYALERLQASGETDDLHRSHAAYFVGLAETAEPEIRGAQQARWMGVLDADLDNIRAALHWTLEYGEVEPAMRLAGAMARFWWTRGYLSEGRRWLDELVSRNAHVEPGIRAKVLNGAGILAWSQGDYSRATELYEACLEIRRETGDVAGVALSLNNLGTVAEQQGDRRSAIRFYEEALDLERQVGDPWALALVLNNLAGVLNEDDQERSIALCEESLALRRQLGDKLEMARVLFVLGSIALDRGEYERSLDLHRESLSLCYQLHNTENIAVCLEGLAKLSAAMGEVELAARLWGAEETVREQLGQPLPPVKHEERVPYLEGAREKAGESAFLSAWEEGSALTLEQVLDLAMREPALL